MVGETVVGVAIFGIIAIILVFGWLSSEYAKGSQKLSESPLAERVPVVSTDKENVSYETMEAPAMRRSDGGREPLRNRVQPIKHKATSTSTGRSDTAYGHPVTDTFDYGESSRSTSVNSSSGGHCSGGSSSSGDSGGSSGCD